MAELNCARCYGSILDAVFAVEDDDKYLHLHVEDCVAFQAGRIIELEKLLARAVKTISTIESDVEMLNSVVGRMLDR